MFANTDDAERPVHTGRAISQKGKTVTTYRLRILADSPLKHTVALDPGTGEERRFDNLVRVVQTAHMLAACEFGFGSIFQLETMDADGERIVDAIRIRANETGVEFVGDYA